MVGVTLAAQSEAVAGIPAHSLEVEPARLRFPTQHLQPEDVVGLDRWPMETDAAHAAANPTVPPRRRRVRLDPGAGLAVLDDHDAT